MFSYILDYPTWVMIMILIHVTASVAAIITGIIPMRAKKGGKLHNHAGRTYFWLMMITCASAGMLLTFRFTIFLAMITVLSAYYAIIGYRVLSRKWGEKPHLFDWIVTVFTASIGTIFFGWSAFVVINGLTADEFLIYSIGFGLGLLLTFQVYSDLKAYLNPHTERRWWMYYHMSRMLGSYVTLITALMVQIPTRTIPISMGWIAWVAPGVIGGILISRWVRATKAQFERPMLSPNSD